MVSTYFREIIFLKFYTQKSIRYTCTHPCTHTRWFPITKSTLVIARRNINNLRCADNDNLMAESEEELKSLLMKVKEETEKAGLKFNVKTLRS